MYFNRLIDRNTHLHGNVMFIIDYLLDKWSKTGKNEIPPGVNVKITEFNVKYLGNIDNIKKLAKTAIENNVENDHPRMTIAQNGAGIYNVTIKSSGNPLINPALYYDDAYELIRTLILASATFRDGDDIHINLPHPYTLFRS
jgi:hypothetical protein